MEKNYWDYYNTRQKRNNLYKFLVSRKSAVWIVLGKERQIYWKYLLHDIHQTTKNYEQMRLDLFDEYINGLRTSGCKRRVDKLFFVLTLLGTKNDWDNFSNKKIII